MAVSLPEKVNVTSSGGPTLYKRLNKLLHTSQWSDCTFIVGDGENKHELRAHRIILASCSPVFEAMCFGPLAETDRILIPDVERAAFSRLLQFVYTDKVEFSAVEEACDVLYAAKKYMLENLCDACLKYIVNNLQANDVVTVYEYAKVLQEESLFEPCLLMMRKYALEVLADTAHHISPASVTELLASDAINGCECCLTEGTLSWAARECEQRGLPRTGSNQRAILNECGAWLHLRLLTLSPQQFSRISQIEDLLTADEICLVQEFLSKWNSVDDKRASSCANMCSSNAVHYCPMKKLIPGPSETNISSNVVVVRDKWKRRRLNMVLVVADDSECKSTSDSKLDIETQTTDIEGPYVPPTVTLPPSISNVINRRKEVGYRLVFCQRPWLKQSLTASCPLTLQVSLCVSAPIDLRAIQLYTRLIPPSVALFKSNSYKEKLELKIYDSKSLISHQYFTDKVQYNTEALVYLNKFVRLRQDRTYCIVVKLLDSVAEYPLSFLGQFAHSQGITFQFTDGAAKAGTDTFLDRLDMGFISGFAYS